EGQVIRVSFSNLFKEFKSTATWLHFPFLYLVGPAPSTVRWTCLMMDLQYVLSVYLNRRHSHLKTIKLCANMSVKNMFTSDLVLDPGVSFNEAKQAGLASSLGTGPMPREMSFPVPKGGSWHDLYDYIRFPSDGAKMPFDSIQKGYPCPVSTCSPAERSPMREMSRSVNISKSVQDRVSLIQQITTPKLHPRHRTTLVTSSIPELGVVTSGLNGQDTSQDDWNYHGDNLERGQGSRTSRSHRSVVRIPFTDDGGVHVYAHTEDDINTHREDSDVEEIVCTAVSRPVTLPSAKESQQRISSGQQRFFIGHTDKVSALTFNGNSTVLASAQTGIQSVVRVWNYLKANCLAMFKTHAHSLSSLSFSYSGGVLCGVGKDGHSKTYHALDFTDVAFEEGHSADREPEDRTLFASSRSGHILEIDYGSVAIKNVRRLLPAQQPHAQRREKQTFSMGMGIAVNSISVSSAFCATGSEDGFLRLWPLDFSTVFLEAEHEGPVSLVSVSDDGLSVMAATSSGNLGYLDVSSRGYSTLMRSHTDGVLGFSVDGIRRRITTASCDRTVRVWDMDSMQQLYDFVSEDTPCSVAFHPSLQVFCCGSSSGLVRVFDIASAKLLAEHNAGSLGALALYNSSQEDHHVLRVLGELTLTNTHTIQLELVELAVSSDNRCLAFVGPSEYTVTIMDARSLDELLRVDVSILDVESTSLDSALKVVFLPGLHRTPTGHHLRQQDSVSKAHKHQCSSLAVSEDGRFLLTAGHNAVKVWDYSMQLDVNSQMFIGHSQPIRQVNFSPDQMAVVSVGDAIFFWDFLAHPQEAGTDRRSPPKAASVSPPKPAPKGHSESEVSSRLLSNGMPRRTAPLPSSPLPSLGRLSLCEEDTDEVLPSPAPAGPSPRPASGSFLKVTEMVAGGSTATPQPGEEGLSLKAVIGYNGNGRANMVWNPETGLFAYSCGCVVVVENLHTGSQRHWLGHTEEISSLAVTNDAQTVASAAGGSGGSRSLICIWNVQDGTCRDFTDPEVALWSTRTYQLLSRVSVSGPLHDVAFSPSAASQLACVGSQGLYFCNTHTQGLDVELKVQRVCVPEELGDVEPTALCYNANSILFTGTNSGHVCAWDCNTQRCFMTWEADQGEIAVQGMRPGGEASNTEDRGALVLLEQEMMLDGTVVCAAFDDVMDMGIVNDVVFSPDESHFATCGDDGSVRVWSAPSNELVVQFQVLNQSCGSACWSPVVSPSKGGACVVGGYSDGTLRIFHLASSEMELKLHPHPVAITAIQYSANGQVILSAGRDGLMAVSSPYKEFGLEGNEMWLAASADRRVSVWAADWMKDKCELLDWLTFPAPANPEESDSLPPSLAAFSPIDPGLVVYTGYGVERELSFYSLAKKRVIKKIALSHWAMCFSLSSKGRLIADFLHHSDSLQTCRFSPSGKLLFTVAYNEILLWEVHGL
ncbi:unnamed protein product, partial [Coregonus sp. 'balchen']